MTDVWERAQRLPPAERQAFIAWARQQVARRTALTQYAHPAELAAALDPSIVITDAVRVVSETMEAAITTPGARKIITIGPQEGKTTCAIHAVLRALQADPDRRILYVSYSEELAVRSSREARNLIARHGSEARDPLTGLPMPDRLGLALAADRSAAGSWKVKGHRGGMIGVGIGGTLTGQPADIIVIDDPLKGMAAADSEAERRKVIEGWQGNIQTRLAPGGSIFIINTRWHELDLTGWLLARDTEQGTARWDLVNIPAVAEPGLPDALGRAPGTELVSARGHRDWPAIRAEAGERVWYALYQGSPTPTGGALFSAAWFEQHRLEKLPPLGRRIVAVDPAETGKGDEAGIIAAGLSGDGKVVLTDDESGLWSSAQWPRRACLLALRTGASELVFEAYAAARTYADLLARAYNDLLVEAAANSGVVEGVRVPARCPYLVSPWKGRGNALVRSTGLRNATSTGRCRVVGFRLSTLEAQATRWQEGQHQPDRVAAATIAFDVLAPARPTGLAGGAGGWGTMPLGIGGR